MFGHSKTHSYETLEHDDDPKYYRPQDHKNLIKPKFATNDQNTKKIEGDHDKKVLEDKHSHVDKQVSHDAHHDAHHDSHHAVGHSDHGHDAHDHHHHE